MSERDIFAAALERTDPASRAAFLDEACGGDPGLRARVERLLRAHDRPDSLLDVPPAAPAATAGQEADPGGDTTSTLGGGSRGAPEEIDLGFLAPPGRPDSLGRIGHYDVLEVLGRGGFGIVFRAFDGVLERVVAVKVLAPLLAVTSPARKRFLREARSAAAVRHENVVRVYSVEEQPLPYLVMEFIPGETLQARLNRTGPFGVVEVVRFGRQIADGLAAAHAQGLVHRDVKPTNVLVEAGSPERAKLTDFGLARAADDASLSQSGVVAGTPMYMSPEQARGESLDHRTDLFSLGSVLYAITSGRPPFRADGAVAVLKRVAEDAPRPIREIIPETPDWLCRVVEKLHAKDPAERFQTAREVADLLADCERQLAAHGGLKDTSRIPARKPAARRRWRRLAAGLAALALLVGTVLLAAGRDWFAGRANSRADPSASRSKEPADDETKQDDRKKNEAAAKQLAAVEAELKERNPAHEIVTRTWIENGQVLGLWFEQRVDDITPLAALRHLQVLSLAGGPTDFAPLRGLPLRRLDCSSMQITDLTSLRGMPLEHLMLWGWKESDLTPLVGMKLKWLNVGGGGARPDLTLLKGMPLTTLYLNYSGVTDLKPLAGLPLKILGLWHTRVSDLSPLRGLPLEELNCEGTAVTDFGPLAGTPLKRLRLDYVPERDAEALRGIKTLGLINERPAAAFLKRAGKD